MKIKDLLSALPEYHKLLNKTSGAVSLTMQDVSDLCQDSRKITPGCVFVALKGETLDSHQFLPQVTSIPLSAVVVEDARLVSPEFKGLVLQVKNSRQALDLLAARYYGDPSRKLLMFGVTGTNGKTSVTYLIEHILNAVRVSTGVIGTIDHHFQDQVWTTGNTTPGALELQQRLSQMLSSGAKAIAMEVTSHALAQHRADSVQFNVVVFTNLTLDHLDYHKTMQNYFEAKQLLFTERLWQSDKVPVSAIVNIDDPWGQKLQVASSALILTYGKSMAADFQYEIQGGDFAKTKAKLRTSFGEFKTELPLVGEHSIANAIAAVAACASVGIPVSASLQALSHFAGVPGRLQSVPNEKGLHVLVDYAHSPDALERVVRTLQQIREEQKLKASIRLVFGCGGDRDKSKRAVMGEIADRCADFSIITSDNPRSENPEQILQDIRRGFKKQVPVIEVDRRKAILLALSTARAGDVILIAGRGHETLQEIQGEKLPFHDFSIAKEALR